MSIESTLFPVKEYPANFAYNSEGGISDVNVNTGYKFIVREDTNQVLSCMTDEYKLVPNSQIVKAAEPILKQHKAKLREAVSLGDGQRTIWKWSLPNSLIEISKGDEMHPEVIIKNSYDGSLQVHILSGAFRLVCSNGMIIGNIIEKYNYKHNIGNVNLDNLEEVIVDVIEKTEEEGRQLPLLKDTKLKQSHIIKLIELFPSTMSAFITQYMIANKPKTYWDLYNVATYINTHKMNRKYNTTHQLENKLYSSVKKWATA